MFTQFFIFYMQCWLIQEKKQIVSFAFYKSNISTVLDASRGEKWQNLIWKRLLSYFKNDKSIRTERKLLLAVSPIYSVKTRKKILVSNNEQAIMKYLIKWKYKHSIILKYQVFLILTLFFLVSFFHLHFFSFLQNLT